MRRRLMHSFAVVIALAHTTAGVSAAHSANLDCLIEPYVITMISSPVEGVLATVTVDRGDLVKEGQVLATLEAGVEKADLAVARARAEMEATIKSSRARVEFGERRLARTKGLFEKEIISFREHDEAETAKVLAEMSLLEGFENKRLAELEFRRAQVALGMRTIRSPITGVVAERLLSPGEFAGKSPILKLAQIDPLRVEVFAPVSLLGKVHGGMRARVVLEQPLNGAYIARVTVVDRVVDAASGTFGVRLELRNPGYRLPAGLKCKVLFLPKSAQAAPAPNVTARAEPRSGERRVSKPAAALLSEEAFWVQVGAFKNSKRAARLADRLGAEQYPAVTRRGTSRAAPHVVWVGKYASRERAEAVRAALARKGFRGFVLRAARQ